MTDVTAVRNIMVCFASFVGSIHNALEMHSKVASWI